MKRLAWKANVTSIPHVVAAVRKKRRKARIVDFDQELDVAKAVIISAKSSWTLDFRLALFLWFGGIGRGVTFLLLQFEDRLPILTIGCNSSEPVGMASRSNR